MKNFREFFEPERYKKNNLEYFLDYYRLMMNMGDCDPSFPMMNYICDRFELNTEQRFWLAFLYGTNYCAPTVYYIYNEFPDYEKISLSRMQKWWDNNKHKTIFQTDRAKVKNFNEFLPIIRSYQKLVGKCQFEKFYNISNYEELYEFSSRIHYFGRFSIFNYTQALWELTPIKFLPTFFDLKKAESCKNGLCYVFDKQKYINAENLKINYKFLQKKLDELLGILKNNFLYLPVNIWNVETALCAFKKLFWAKRYLGYYIDRQLEEIRIMEKNVNDGVSWKPLYDFREEFFDRSVLGEFNNWGGIRKNNMNIFSSTRKFGNKKDFVSYKRKVEFKRAGECYEEV